MSKATLEKVIQDLADEVIKGLEEGKILPWSRSWSTLKGPPMPVNGLTGKRYRGGNTILLFGEAMGRRWPNEWWTVKQAESKGGTLKKGEVGTAIIYFRLLVKDADGNVIDSGELDDAQLEDADRIPVLSTHIVFNRQQFEGLPPSKWIEAARPINKHTRDAEIDAVIDATGATIEYMGDQPFYSPSADKVVMPKFEQFHDAPSFYSTFFHELTHWTGGPKRLDRIKHGKFGDETYAFEELVAELGSAMCCLALGIELQKVQHVAYLQGWIRKLKDHPRTILRASSLAGHALDLLIPEYADEIPEDEPARKNGAGGASYLHLTDYLANAIEHEESPAAAVAYLTRCGYSAALASDVVAQCFSGHCDAQDAVDAAMARHGGDLPYRSNSTIEVRRNGHHPAEKWAKGDRKPAIDFGEMGQDRQALAKWLQAHPGKTAAFKAAGTVYHSAQFDGQVFTVPASRKNGTPSLQRKWMEAQERKNYAWDAITELESAGKPVPKSALDAYNAARAEWLALDRQYEAESSYKPRRNGRQGSVFYAWTKAYPNANPQDLSVLEQYAMREGAEVGDNPKEALEMVAFDIGWQGQPLPDKAKIRWFWDLAKALRVDVAAEHAAGQQERQGAAS